MVLNLDVTVTRSELADAARAGYPSRRIRIGQALIWAGRAYLLALILVSVVCGFAGPAWISADTAMIFLLVFAILWPWLLLPVTSIALTTSEGGCLYGVSVLGRRRVATDSLRATRVTLPGRGYSSYVAVLRDHRLRLLIVVGTGMWEASHFDEVAGHSIPDPDQTRRALLRYLAGIAAMVVSVLIGVTMMVVIGNLLAPWAIHAN